MLESTEQPFARKHQYFAHPTALVETDEVGPGTRIWAFCHVLQGSRIGSGCNIGDHCYIEQDVTLGNGVVVKNGVSVWSGVTLHDRVFVGPNVAFTNDLRPRAKTPPTEWLRTVVCHGASLGANSTIIPGVRIGRYAMVGAGSVVTADVPDYALVVGNPARSRGYVCECSARLTFEDGLASCECERKYRCDEDRVIRCR